MRAIPNNQAVKKSFVKVRHVVMPGVGGMLLSFLLISREVASRSLPDLLRTSTTETSIVGWSLFWFMAFILGGIMGMLLYPLFRRQSLREESDLDPRRDKILIIGSGLLTALILITLYLLTQHTLATLTTSSGSAQFVIEVKNDPVQKISCSDQRLIAPREIQGSLGEPAILKLTSASDKPGFQTFSLHLKPHQQATHLTTPQSQQITQTSCSRCHAVDVKAQNALTFLVSWSTLQAEAGLNTPGHLQVNY